MRELVGVMSSSWRVVVFLFSQTKKLDHSILQLQLFTPTILPLPLNPTASLPLSTSTRLKICYLLFVYLVYFVVNPLCVLNVSCGGRRWNAVPTVPLSRYRFAPFFSSSYEFELWYVFHSPPHNFPYGLADGSASVLNPMRRRGVAEGSESCLTR